MNLLSKKKLKFVIFGLFLVVIIGFLASQPNHLKYGGNEILLAGTLDRGAQIKILENINKKDTDNDGLKDWEEELWGTDLRNPDTDGDGTKDSDEIQIGRDPLNGGLNDEVNNKPFAQNKENKSESTFKSLTDTDIFAQNLFTEYLSLRRSNESLNDIDKNFLVNSAVADALNTESNKQYEIANLNITNDNSVTAFKRYGNDFAQIIQFYSNNLPQDELTVFERILRTEDKKDIVYLSESAGVYRSAVDELKYISVPSDLTFVHLDILNSYMAISGALEDMSLVLDDPIRGLSGFSIYTNTKDLQVGLFKKIIDSLIENRVVFSVSEVGYMWHTI